MNRFYGDGLNKLEPKDVEAMPCPEMPTLRRADSERLIRQLEHLESLSGTDRVEELDALIARYFKFPVHSAA